MRWMTSVLVPIVIVIAAQACSNGRDCPIGQGYGCVDASTPLCGACIPEAECNTPELLECLCDPKVCGAPCAGACNGEWIEDGSDGPDACTECADKAANAQCAGLEGSGSDCVPYGA